MSVSFEEANCKFDAMVEKWILKLLNFTAAGERWRYACKLARQGMAQKARRRIRKLADQEA